MRFFLFSGIAQAIPFFGHWFSYKTLTSFFGVTRPEKLWILRIVLGVLSVSFIGSSFLSLRYSSLPVQYLYTASVSWLGFLYLFFLASALAWIIWGTTKLFHFSLDRKILMIGLIAFSLMASIYGFWNATAILITTVTLPLSNLPDAWKDKTAVWISDVHLGQVRNHRFAQEITRRIQELRPGIVFIGGDLFDGGKAMDLNHMVQPFFTDLFDLWHLFRHRQS